MHTHNERGIALVLALFLMSALSVLAASLMFLSQTETYASLNYRMMSQTRYAAESGMAKASNFLLDQTTPQYTLPSAAGPTDLLTYYDRTKSPVVCAAGAPVCTAGQPIILSATSCKASNYPVAAVQTAFDAAAHGTLTAGTNATLTYCAYATLMAMQQFTSYGGGPTVVQTWQITADGGLTGPRSATVEVVGTIETMKVPAHLYAAFATNNGCGALKFTSGSLTDSYDSTAALVSGVPVLTSSYGNVGSNGNLTESGGATVHGTLSTPRTGVGACSAGNVTAETASGGASVSGGLVQLPQPVSLTAPAAPSPAPPTTANVVDDGYTCVNASIVLGCTGTSGVLTLDPTLTATPGTMTLGNLALNNSATLHLKAGTYNINSITMSGASVVIDSGPVIMNVAGAGQTTPINLSGGLATGSFDASKFQIQYAGTNHVILRGGFSGSEMVYAPNANITFSQGGAFYGSIVGATISDTGAGGIQIHYDRNLNRDFFVVGSPIMGSFSWKRF